MKVDVLIGLQWGDEGKGKIVDVLAPDYAAIARFQGGPNAGHTLEFHQTRHILHTVPSGIFRKNIINIIGNGVVLDPEVFKNEVESIKQHNEECTKNLFISNRAHLILPSHRILDRASEAAKGQKKIGSTLRGIGPTYMDKTGRNGLRVGDILNENFKEKYENLKSKHKDLLKIYNYEYNIEEDESKWFEAIEYMKSFQIVDTEILINDLLKQNKKILAEGAQGSLLDIDFGTYPYVTSSNTICSGACTGLGIPPSKVGEVIGIFKAYCTRVGSGPFPTEQLNEVGEKLRERGCEFGSTTGRPRRCGWLDLPALKYSVMLNGVTQLFMTKVDVLSDFDTIKVCTHYKVKGEITDKLPFDLETIEDVVYTEIKGWKKDISRAKSIKDLPRELINYIEFIEKQTEVPITMISVGPDRNQILRIK